MEALSIQKDGFGQPPMNGQKIKRICKFPSVQGFVVLTLIFKVE